MNTSIFLFRFALIAAAGALNVNVKKEISSPSRPCSFEEAMKGTKLILSKNYKWVILYIFSSKSYSSVFSHVLGTLNMVSPISQNKCLFNFTECLFPNLVFPLIHHMNKLFLNICWRSLFYFSFFNVKMYVK